MAWCERCQMGSIGITNTKGEAICDSCGSVFDIDKNKMKMYKIKQQTDECKEVVFGSYEHYVTLEAPDRNQLKNWNGDRKTSICVDKCLADEVKYLWSQGIKTTNCCCGHNKLPPTMLVTDDFIEKMRNLGYENLPKEYYCCGSEDRPDMFIAKSIEWVNKGK